jgi:aminoglycoside phosphotransferase (APT) family kinase protein
MARSVSPSVNAVNRVFEVQDVRGRLIRREWASPELAGALGIDPETEVAAHRLAANVGLAPPVLDYDPVQRFMVMPVVEGLRLETDWAQRPERRAAVRALIGQLRAIDASRLPALNISDRLLALRERLTRCAPHRAHRYQAEVDVCVDRLAAISGGCSVLVHGDLTPENVIVRDDGSLCLLDWEYAHCGHGDEDLAGLALEARGLDAWSLAPAEFDVRVRSRRLLDGLWRELAAVLAG